MNIFKKTIVYFLVVTSILSPLFFLGAPQKTSAADVATDCSNVTDAYFEPITVSSPVTKDGTLSFNYPGSTNPSIKVVVETQGCVSQRINIHVIEGVSIPTSLKAFDTKGYLVPPSGKVELTVKPSEEDCTIGSSVVGSYNCQYKVIVTDNGSNFTSPTYDSSTHTAPGVNKGYGLNYNCSGLSCTDGFWKVTAKNTLEVSKTCAINYKTAFYTNLGPTPINLRSADNPGLELPVFYDGCIGWTGDVTLEEISGTFNHKLPEHFPFVFDPNGGPTRLGFVAGEEQCDKTTPNCSVVATITPYDGATAGTAYTTEKIPLDYNCLVPGECTGTTNETAWHRDDNPSNLATPLTSKTPVGILSSASDCEIVSTGFDPYTTKDGLADYELKHLETHGWFVEDSRDILNKVTLTIKTKKCAGTNIFVDIVGKDLQSASLLHKELPISTLHNRAFTVPASEVFTITLVAGEEDCRSWGGNIVGTGITGADCKFNIQASTLDLLGHIKKMHDSIDEPYGNLNYECNTNCDQDILWKYAGDTSAKPYPSDPLNDQPPTNLEDNTTSSTSPDCIDKATGKPIDGCYQLYGGFADVLKGKFNNLNSIGDFINAIIALAIGIAGVLTVGMIMWDGFTYWKAGKEGSESDLGAVKGRIWKRLLGLLLLFTIYTLLRTINPDLLNLTPRIDSVNFKTGGDTETALPNQPSVDIKQKATDYGISCPGSGGVAAIPTIAQSFFDSKKITYAYGAKGSPGPSNTLNYDCSGFVNAVYTCAGLSSPGGGTGGIFSGATGITSITATTVNSQSLAPGDLLGWTAGSLTGGAKEDSGHVVMYIGNGKTIESTSNNQGTQPGKAIQIRNADAYKIIRLKFFKKAP